MYRLLFQPRTAALPPVTGDAVCLLIGRATGCGLRLTDAGVHDRHAVLERRATGYFLRDLTASNGVHINGTAVTDQRLATGDEIEIGAVRFVFEVVHEPPPDRRAFDPWQCCAAGIVVLVATGQLGLFAWILAQPHPRGASTDIVTSKPPEPPAAPVATHAPALVPLTSDILPVARAPEILSRMLKIVSVDRTDATTLRILVLARVGDRQLAPNAVAISVQCSPTAPVHWLPVPVQWENFKKQEFIAHWPEPCTGYVVRTYYRNQLQDVLSQL